MGTVGTKVLKDNQRFLQENLKFDEANKHHLTRTDEVIILRRDTVSTVETITGRAQLGSLTSENEWQIFRDIIVGNETVREWPLTLGAEDSSYVFKYDDRSGLFAAIPFSNSFSIQFDGANDFITIPDDTTIDFDFRTEAATFSCWVKSSLPGAVTVMEKQDGSTQGWRFYIEANDLKLEIRGSGGGADRIRVRTTAADSVGLLIQDGSWHNITATMDTSGLASGVTLYLDAVVRTVEIQNDTLSTTTSHTGNMAIGSNSSGSNNFGPGNMDEVSIWDVELSSANITTIYNAGQPIDLQAQGVSPITVSLNAWWRMGDGDTFPIIQDQESTNDGTMTNMTAGDIETEVPT